MSISPLSLIASEAKAPAGTAAFAKFIVVLQHIADATEPPTVAKLAQDSAYPRPTVHRIVAALLAEGLIEARGAGNVYALGPRLMGLASLSWARSDLRTAAGDVLKDLRNRTEETVHLAVPSDGAMIYIEKLESLHAVQVASRIGMRVALTSTSVGKAWLASLPPAQQVALVEAAPRVRLTARTLIDPVAIAAELEYVATQGYAEDCEENEDSIWCVGAAIVGLDGRALGCVSVSLPRFRRHDDVRRHYVDPLLRACQAIAARLGPMPVG